MLLNKAIRGVIVARVMSDVPKTDYTTKATDMIAKFVRDNTPPQIAKLQASPNLAGWFTSGTSIWANSLGYLTIKVHSSLPNLGELKSALLELAEKNDAEQSSRKMLRAKVEANIAACKTSKELEERFPDFAKYLPKSESEAHLPATTDLLDTLKSAGWPAGKSKKAK